MSNDRCLAFLLNFHIFFVIVDSDPEAEFALENLNIISMSSWYSVYASALVLLEEFHILYVKVHSDVHAWFALEIWTLFLQAVWQCLWRPGGLTGFSAFFSRSSGLSRS